MQTIEFEKPKKIEDPMEWARGRNGMFKTPNICIYANGSGGTMTLAVDSQKGGKTSPILICLKRATWYKVLTALGKELGDSYDPER